MEQNQEPRKIPTHGALEIGSRLHFQIRGEGTDHLENKGKDNSLLNCMNYLYILDSNPLSNI